MQFAAYQKLQKSTISGARATHGDWSEIGPFDYWGGDVFSGGGIGRVNCTAFHPTDPNTFWVGTANGGLWKTIDGGSSWTPLTESFAAIGISSIVVNPTNPNQIYILTGDGDARNSVSAINRNSSIGVLKTNDGGNTWNPTDLSFGLDSLRYGYKLVMHPTNSNILLAVFAGIGIYRTTNGGAFWSNVELSRTVWDIEFKPGDPSTVYAASDGGFLVSPDGGVTWSVKHDPAFPAPFTYTRMAIAISPSEPSNVYALFGGGGAAGTFQGVFKSINSGLSFNPQSTTPNILGSTMDGSDQGNQAGYDLCLLVDPTDDSRVFVGGINLWKSENNGVSWGRETWWTKNFEPFDPYVHADWHNIYFNNSTLYANVDGGIYKSTDLGNDWTELTKGLSIMQFYEIAVKGNTYMGGTQDNGTNEADDTNTQCHSILGGDGFGCTWHTTNNSIQYLCTQDRLARRQYESNVFIWQEGNGFWRTDIKMHKTDADYFFFDKGNELFRANQASIAVWDFHFDSLKTNNAFTGAGEILGFDQGTGSNDNIMYVVNRANLLKTTNLANDNPTWVNKTNPVSGVANLSDVIQDPSNPNEVWLTCSGYVDTSKVYFSVDGGNSWTNITGTLPNIPVRCITYHAGTNNGLYLGTDLGIFYRNTAMSDWVYFSNQLPNTRVVDIEISGGNVYAGTYGRGVWKSQAYSSCPSNLTLTQANDPSNPISIGEQHYHALNSITTSREINGMTAEIYYNSGNYIDMKPGFIAEQSTFMHAKISGCPD
jgi:photosystem II stability/assembly factor-like uncharacterized protein